MQFNIMLQAYAGSGDFATVRETQDLERLNRVDFHTFILSKKRLYDQRREKLK